MPRNSACRKSSTARDPTEARRRAVIRPAGARDYLGPHAAAVRRQQRSPGVAAGSRHHDLGQGHRRARSPRPADRVLRGRRHPGRHRCGLHRRPLRGAARHPGRRRRTARRRGARDEGGHLAPRGERTTDTSRRALLGGLDTSLTRLGVEHVDLWQVHVWSDEVPLDETLAALDQAVSSGRATYVGISNYSGWQTAQAATWQRRRPVARRSCPPRSSTPSSTARSSARSCRRAPRSGSGSCRGRPSAGVS